MKNFNIRRFCAVARWDLTINRAFYNKMAMAIAACSILPVLFYHAIELLEKVIVLAVEDSIPGLFVVAVTRSIVQTPRASKLMRRIKLEAEAIRRA